MGEATFGINPFIRYLINFDFLFIFNQLPVLSEVISNIAGRSNE